MSKIILILIAIIAILGSILFVTLKSNNNNKKDAVRWENNYNESLDSIQRVTITYSEFKDKFQEKYDSLLDLNKIKPKQVEKIITINNVVRVTDTFYMQQYENNYINGIYTISFTKDTSCISLSGFIKTEDSNSKIGISNLSYNSESNYIAYWNRNRYKFLGLFYTKFLGKKIGTLHVASKCGDVKVKEIDIIKKK